MTEKKHNINNVGNSKSSLHKFISLSLILLLASFAISFSNSLFKDFRSNSSLVHSELECNQAVTSNSSSDFKKVNISIDGQVHDIQTSVLLVADLLKEKNLAIAPEELININMDSAITDGMTIEINKIVESNIVETREIPFEIKKQANSSKKIGTESVLINGKNGIERLTYKLNTQSGKQLSKVLCKQELITAPVNKIIEYGTKKEDKTRIKPTRFQDIKIPVAVASRGASNYIGCKRLKMKATAYTKYEKSGGGPRTATGHAVRRGIIAVDPKIIPIGTQVFIEGYGEAVALDTGGRIKGNIIDVYVDSLSEAVQWGRREVQVYIKEN